MGLSVPLDGVSADAVIFCESVSALDKLDLNLFIIDSRILKFMKITEFEIGQFCFLSLDPDSQTAGAGRRDPGALESDSVFGVVTQGELRNDQITLDTGWSLERCDERVFSVAGPGKCERQVWIGNTL